MTPREIDCKIASKIMNESPFNFIRVSPNVCLENFQASNDGIDWVNVNYQIPNYSADISAAWKVVEKLKTIDQEIYYLSRAFNLTLTYRGTGYGWRAEFDLENDNAGDDQTHWSAEEETAPLAICLAALQIVEYT